MCPITPAVERRTGDGDEPTVKGGGHVAVTNQGRGYDRERPDRPHGKRAMSDEKITIMPAYLRVKDAAAYVGLSEPMLLKLVRAGQGPPRIRKGRCVLYSLKALQDWMNRDEAAA